MQVALRSYEPPRLNEVENASFVPGTHCPSHERLKKLKEKKWALIEDITRQLELHANPPTIIIYCIGE